MSDEQRSDSQNEYWEAVWDLVWYELFGIPPKERNEEPDPR